MILNSNSVLSKEAKPSTAFKIFALSMTTFAISDAIGNIVINLGFTSPFLNLIRYAIIFILISLYLIYKQSIKDVFKTEYLKIIILRGFLQGLGAVLYFAAMQFLPLSMAASIFFCAPIVLLAVSPFILNEKVGIRQWFTVLLGFIGMFCIVNPFSLNLSNIFSDSSFLGIALALSGMFAFLGTQVMTKKVSGKAPLTTILFWGNLLSMLVSALASFLFSSLPQSIPFSTLMLILIMALLALIAQFLFVIPYKLVKASDLAPLNYLQLAVTIAIGIIFFEERPLIVALTGMFLIVLAGTLQGIYAKKGVY